jgi:hypothetical protein
MWLELKLYFRAEDGILNLNGVLKRLFETWSDISGIP